MALGLKAGVDVDLMIKAVAAGSGGSAQFGVRAPWMAQRRFLPAHGNVPGLSHYFELIGALADRVGVAPPLLDRAIELYERCTEMGLGELDHAVMVDVIASMPRDKARKNTKAARPKNRKSKPKKTKKKKKTIRKSKRGR
jgi:3-hydroxyisobutyrate dehydrogenase